MTDLSATIISLLQQHKFEFPDLPDRLKCTICHNVLQNASQTPCGCRVCLSCIADYLRDNSPRACPSDSPTCSVSISTADITPDNAINREIANFPTKCPFVSCSFVAPLKSLINHIDLCDYRSIICGNCSETVPFPNKSIHDLSECEMRIVKCVFCGKSMTNKSLTRVHLNDALCDDCGDCDCMDCGCGCHGDCGGMCERWLTRCPNECAIETEVNLKTHLPLCVNRKIECPFRYLQCQIDKMSHEKLLGHLNDEQISHSKRLIDKIRDLENCVNRLTEESDKFHRLLTELMDANRLSTDSCLRLQKTVSGLSKSISENRSPIESISRGVIGRNASLIWRFSDFDRKRLEAINGERMSITSDPFFTSEFGYKLCGKVYPDGDGAGKGTHLSVFFSIMKGEFDELLSWPFKQNVTMSVLDLHGGNKNHSMTFKPDIRSICYQKPVEEFNLASGSPQFILLSEITSNDSLYCKNDTIYIKISVDTFGISKP